MASTHSCHSHLAPGLETSISEFRASHQGGDHNWSCGSKKLLILIPLNANISHKLEEQDDSIQFFHNLPNNEMDRAGVRGRVYKHSVYTVLDEHGKVKQLTFPGSLYASTYI